jgi:hypothetical protein
MPATSALTDVERRVLDAIDEETLITSLVEPEAPSG